MLDHRPTVSHRNLGLNMLRRYDTFSEKIKENENFGNSIRAVVNQPYLKTRDPTKYVYFVGSFFDRLLRVGVQSFGKIRYL